MIRLFEIEWLKLKNYKVFWILVIMYFAGLLIVLSSGMFLMQFLKSIREKHHQNSAKQKLSRVIRLVSFNLGNYPLARK